MIVDASGSTDSGKGKVGSNGSHDPIIDVKFLERN